MAFKAYLSPRELGSAIGVSESSLKRWADEGRIDVSRTAGGHRRIYMAEVVRFIRDSGMPVLKPQLLGLDELAEGQAAVGEEAAALESALTEGRASRVRGIIVSQYLAGVSLASICDDVIAPAMQHIGSLWEHGDSGIFIEHRATDLAIQALNHLRVLMPRPQDTAPIAVGGCTQGDPYALASLMVATVLAADGWREMNLGPDTPDAVLLSAVEQADVELAWLGVNLHESPGDLPQRIVRMAEALGQRNTLLVGGGRSWPRRITGAPANLHTVSSMSELAALARGRRSASS